MLLKEQKKNKTGGILEFVSFSYAATLLVLNSFTAWHYVPVCICIYIYI